MQIIKEIQWLTSSLREKLIPRIEKIVYIRVQKHDRNKSTRSDAVENVFVIFV